MQQSLDELLAKLARNKFNAIRLTVNHLSILRNEAMTDYGDLDVAKNPWFAGNRYVSCPALYPKGSASRGAARATQQRFVRLFAPRIAHDVGYSHPGQVRQPAARHRGTRRRARCDRRATLTHPNPNPP